MHRDSPLPAGTVTLVFTDIEGSTKLLAELGDGYGALLAEHRLVVREAFQARGGAEVDTQGDSFFYAFESAGQAVEAAKEAQARSINSRMRMRIGIHTGEPMLTAEGYVGIDVHRAARIMGAGHGGQVLISASTRDLLPDDVQLTDLGEHRLKDLSAPQRLWQLGTQAFPPLRTLYQTNLPVQPWPIVGRARELAEAEAMLRSRRLVTLIGPGGSGKTRLALQLAAQLVEAFPDGVWWVPLAGVTDYRLVLPSIAQAVGASAELTAHLRSKRTLVLLDNVEQVIECASDIAALLTNAPGLKVLATSREPLRVEAEEAYAVEPLAEDEATNLFVERARQAEPRAAILEICRRLDRLPLAIELAAARTAILPPEELLARLDQRLALLTGGRRDAPERQRTLRATIEWSHDLLGPEEQALFRRLAVFAGSFSLEAAEVVAHADLDTLQSLVEKSLVRRWPTGRFGMLETIHEYARERLEGHPDLATLRPAHEAFFLELAEATQRAIMHHDRVDWLVRLEEDHANVRAALESSLVDGRPETTIAFCAALREFWMRHGHLAEGRRWIAIALRNVTDGYERERAGAAYGGSVLANLQGDWQAAKELAEVAVPLARGVGDPLLVAGSVMAHGRPLLALGDVDGARRNFTEAIEVGAGAGLPFLVGMATFNLAYLHLTIGELALARDQMRAALDAFQHADDDYGVARALTGLGSIALREGGSQEAAAYLRDALARSHAGGNLEGAIWALELLGTALANLDPQRAARLLGAAEGLRERVGTPLTGTELETHEQALGTIRRAIDADVMAAAWTEGREMELAEVVDAEAEPLAREPSPVTARRRARG